MFDWRLLGPTSGTQIVFSGPENAIWVDVGAPWEEIAVAIGDCPGPQKPPRSYFRALKMRSGYTWVPTLRKSASDGRLLGPTLGTQIAP